MPVWNSELTLRAEAEAGRMKRFLCGSVSQRWLWGMVGKRVFASWLTEQQLSQSLGLGIILCSINPIKMIACGICTLFHFPYRSVVIKN